MVNKKCKVENCNDKIVAKGYCSKHYCQLTRYGKIRIRTERDPNEIIDCGDYYEICIYEGGGYEKEIARTIIDKKDLEKVKKYKWCIVSGNHVINSKNNLYLHQLILGKKEGLEIDHIDRNPFNNRKSNLRYCTDQENAFNRGCRGYCKNKKDNKWKARITVDGKSIYLGYFKNEEDAKKARREAELKYFGKFSRIN